MKTTRALRKLSALLAAVMLLTLFGCRPGSTGSQAPVSSQQPEIPEPSGKPDKSQRPTVTVCMDMDLGHEGSSASKLTELVHEYAPEFKDSYVLDIEALPGTGGERESSLDHIRVEMMAGGGPDVFLCESPLAADPDLMPPRERQTGLFQYPKALMNRRMFLPLDEYIENSRYMEWDKLYPQIMEAGRNEEGQLILPMGWGMNFVSFDAESYTPTAELPMTFEEMLQSEDSGVREALCLSGFSASLGLVADYETDAPSFTEEELLAHLEGVRENRERRTPELEKSIGPHRPASFGRINAGNFCQYDPDSVLIPLYNRDGGATAYITSFGAVNINTKVPQGAFWILDLLMSKEVQQDSELLSWDRGAPVHMELLKSKQKVLAPFDYNNRYVERWGLTDYNYDRLQELIKEINAVDFVTPVHHELSELYRPYMQAETEGEREKLVSETYKTIKMMLAES